MEKIFDVMGCEDAFKTRLAVYKFEGDALAWWKAYKQAKGGDVWLITVTCAEFNELFFLLFFPRAEQEPAGTAEEQAKNFQWGLRKLPMLLATMRSSMRGMMMALSDQTRGRRVVISISRPLNRVVTGTTVIIMTVMDQTGEAVVTTTAATTTTLATTTGVLVMGVTKETGVSSPTDLSILVSSSPGVPLRATPTRSALRVDTDTQESVVELLVPALSVVKLAICRRITRRTLLRVHLVRLIRSQVPQDYNASSA
nr:hypothetical protein [Tanacetum cinerariifolium]